MILGEYWLVNIPGTDWMTPTDTSGMLVSGMDVKGGTPRPGECRAPSPWCGELRPIAARLSSPLESISPGVTGGVT